MARGDLIEHGELAHRFIVEAEKGNVFGIGAPPVGLPVTVEQFLEINPIGLAVGDEAAAIGCQGALGLRGDINDVQVVVTNECHEFAVGTEGRQFLLAGCFSEANRLGAVKAAVVQIVFVLEKGTGALLVHPKRSGPGQALGGPFAQRGQLGQSLSHFLRIMERL